MAATVFAKIIAGVLPCHRVYDDAWVLAFLDIEPLAKAHTLVVPKRAAATLDALDDESAAALGRVLPRLCRAVMQVSGAQAYNVLQNNGSTAHQAVPHVHFHIIPKLADAGLGIDWPARKLPAEQGTALAAQLVKALAG